MKHLVVIVVLTVGFIGMVVANPAPLRDPTRPYDYQGSDGDVGRQLSGIVHSHGRRFALIGGRVVAEGEQVNGRKVLHIAKHSVTLSDGGKPLTLLLVDPLLKRASNERYR